MSQTLYDKLFEAHYVATRPDGQHLLYIDRHLIHEVTSPQAFSGMSMKQRAIWRKQSMMATADHNVSTDPNRSSNAISNLESKVQLDKLEENCQEHKIELYDIEHENQGIVHVISPELGNTQPGMTLVCGDSHTSTHGAFGVLAMGIGTSMVEHVMATQTILTERLGNMRITINGSLNAGVTPKDVILAVIHKITAAGGIGMALELTGSAIKAMNMEARMTLCNMGVEAGARVCLIGVDQTTIDYLKDKPMSPKGDNWEAAVNYWKTFTSDESAIFDKNFEIEAATISPRVTWGTSPDQSIAIDGYIPNFPDNKQQAEDLQRVYSYMGLKPGQAVKDIEIDRIFIGSCTNSRLSDLKDAAEVVRNRQVSPSVKLAMVVPGSRLVKRQAEAIGLDDVFKRAGFQWREAGCSMCLGMNDDRLDPEERCASTSNRNFEGRQGAGGRTHLVSPITAAAAAITGKLSDPRDLI